MAKIIGAGGRGTQPPQQPKLDMNNSKPMVCKHCSYDVFISGAKFRTISRNCFVFR